jgi:hypothetical protein
MDTGKAARSLIADGIFGKNPVPELSEKISRHSCTALILLPNRSDIVIDSVS